MIEKEFFYTGGLDGESSEEEKLKYIRLQMNILGLDPEGVAEFNRNIKGHEDKLSTNIIEDLKDLDPDVRVTVFMGIKHLDILGFLSIDGKKGMFKINVDEHRNIEFVYPIAIPDDKFPDIEVLIAASINEFYKELTKSSFYEKP